SASRIPSVSLCLCVFFHYYRHHRDLPSFPTLRSSDLIHHVVHQCQQFRNQPAHVHFCFFSEVNQLAIDAVARRAPFIFLDERPRSEEHTSELQSHLNLVCRLLLEKKKSLLR